MALATTPLDNRHPSSPVYKVIDGVAIAAGGALTSDYVDVAAYEEATIFVQAGNGPVSIYAVFSLDGVTFFNTVQHVDTAGPSGHTTGAGPTATTRRVTIAGAPYLAILVTNGAASATTVSAWIALQSVP